MQQSHNLVSRFLQSWQLLANITFFSWHFCPTTATSALTNLLRRTEHRMLVASLPVKLFASRGSVDHLRRRRYGGAHAMPQPVGQSFRRRLVSPEHRKSMRGGYAETRRRVRAQEGARNPHAHPSPVVGTVGDVQ